MLFWVRKYEAGLLVVCLATSVVLFMLQFRGLAIAILIVLPILTGVFALKANTIEREHIHSLFSLREVDVQQELDHVCEQTGVAKRDALRLWLGLSAFFGLPHEKLRATDRLDKELKAAYHDPDGDIVLHWGFLDENHEYSAGLRALLAEGNVTISKLIGFMRTLEFERGFPIVRTERDGGGPVAYLLRSTLCSKCGYDLRGLPTFDCPECGASQIGERLGRHAV